MLTKIIEHEGVKVVMGRATNLSTLMYLVYTNCFRKLMPDIDPFMSKSGDELDEAWAGLSDEMRFLYNKVLQFITLAVDIQFASGLPYRWPKVGEFPSLDMVQTMFSHFMVDTSGLWKRLVDEHAELYQPLTPPEQQPPEVRGPLTELEETDPNSLTVVVLSNPITDNGSNSAPSGEK